MAFFKPNIDKMSAKGDIDGLIKALHHRDAETRIHAIEALGKSHDPRAVQPLIAAAGRRETGPLEYNWSCAIRDAFGEFGETAAEPAMAVLADPQSSEHAGAALTLGQVGDARAVAPLVVALSDAAADARHNAAAALGELCAADDDGAEGGHGVREAVARTDAAEPLIQALGDGDAAVRKEAAVTIGRLRDPRAVEPLVTALGDQDADVRREAAMALGRLGDARAVEPLLATLHDEDCWVRQFAVHALGHLGDERALRPLVGSLLDADEDDLVRRAAAGALGNLGDVRAVTALVRAEQQHDSLFSYARAAYDKLGGEAARRAAFPPVEFDADGHVTAAHPLDMLFGAWRIKTEAGNRYYSQWGTSLLHATELLKAVSSVPGQTYYIVETPDGALCRDKLGFYTEAPINTTNLSLEVSAPATESVDARSLTLFGDDLMGSQTSVALLRSQGRYANFVLLMECGCCGYKSPVETQPGDMERQCYCCGAINTTSRASVTVLLPSGPVEI